MSLEELKYLEMADEDILTTKARYTDLRTSKENYSYPDGTNVHLTKLDGTVPVPYKGTTYNIPISIWLQKQHPRIAPMCYVTPTKSMLICKNHSNVSPDGKIDIPYLKEWKFDTHNVAGCVETLVTLFGKFPPLYRDGMVDVNIASIKAHFGDLRTSKENYIYPDGLIENLTKLSGTVPVLYKGTTYNIPISIWLQRGHPNTAPICYVTPTKSMLIYPNRSYMSSDGKIDIPYLKDWKFDTHNIVGCIRVMVTLFEEFPPLYSTDAPK